MRELVEAGQLVKIIPHNFKNANKGIIKEVSADGFILELEYEPEGILQNNYCEFYTQSKNGMLYFDSYPKEINGKTLKIANPAKHKFLQRRQYTRVKYNHDLNLCTGDKCHSIYTFDVSAGGMKFKTSENINIESEYTIKLPLSAEQEVECRFSPIRIEKNNDKTYTLSGKFDFNDSRDKMTLIQFCAKRSMEIANK